jgi:hypothetical protein
MNVQKFEPRYQKIFRWLKQSRLGKFWTSYITHYSFKSWQYSKRAIWTLSVGSIVLVVPLAIETLLESEVRLMHLNSQIQGDMSPNVEFRPY